MAGSRQEMTCLHCGKVGTGAKHSSSCKFCNNQCQRDYEYTQFIKRWQAGFETGRSGNKNISRFIRRFIFEKFDSKCCECGWGQPHPVDGRIPLEVDHIDGDWFNTTELNLRLLCPNCHSLTITYKNRNRGNSSRNKPS